VPVDVDQKTCAPVSPDPYRSSSSACLLRGAGDEQRVLVERLLQRVAPAVEAQLRETLRVLIQEQILLLTPRFQQEIETAVRQAVAGAMAEVEISRP